MKQGLPNLKRTVIYSGTLGLSDARSMDFSLKECIDWLSALLHEPHDIIIPSPRLEFVEKSAFLASTAEEVLAMVCILRGVMPFRQKSTGTSILYPRFL